MKWILLLPATLLGALILAGFALKIMALLTFDVAFLEGLAIYGVYGAIPSIACHIGINIAPKKNDYIKWAILTPYILAFIVMFAPVLFALLSGGQSFTEQGSLDGYDALSQKWQLILTSLGLAFGTLFAGAQPVDEYTYSTALETDQESK